MRYLVLPLLLSFTMAFAQVAPGKFVSKEEQVSVFLEETPEGLVATLTPGYGVFSSFEVRMEGNELSGTLENGADVTGALEGDTLRLTLDGDETQVLVLTRQQADVPLAEKTPLLSMLSLVPDTVTARQGVPSVSFVDFGAAFGTNPASPQTAEDFAAMSPEAQRTWLKTLGRVRSGPDDLLVYLSIMIEKMPDLLGFEWFDIGRALAYGTPPDAGTLFAATPDPDKLAEKLSGRDFERTTYQGTTLWQKGEEDSIDIAGREPGDPFVGSLGKATRLAVFPDYLANTPTTAMTQAIVDSYDDRYPSLADAADYRTLAEALASEEGTLVQAQFWNFADLGFVPNDPFGMMENPSRILLSPETAPQGDPLPPYGLAVLADSQAGPEQVGTVALLYEDGETAQGAAAVLTARLKDARRAEAEGVGAKYEAWGVRVEDGRIFESSTGLWAAVVSVRYPLPGSAEDAPAPGAVFARWLSEIYNRELGLLEVSPTLTP